jgi:hypothetical protein
MQTWSGQNSSGAASPLRKLTMYVIIGFAIVGLISGFAFGGLTHPNAQNTTASTNPTKKNTPVVQPTHSVTVTPTTQPIVALGTPAFNPYPITDESIAGGTVYTTGMQVLDKANKPIQANSITCKAWLVQQIPTGQILSIDENTLKNYTSINQTITGTVNNTPFQEIPGGLAFDATTPQTNTCNANGQMTWKYQLGSNLTPGTYDIVILADWKGVHYNWSWDNIVVQ